jgi:hypothetical protein
MIFWQLQLFRDAKKISQTPVAATFLNPKRLAALIALAVKAAWPFFIPAACGLAWRRLWRGLRG